MAEPRHFSSPDVSSEAEAQPRFLFEGYACDSERMAFGAAKGDFRVGYMHRNVPLSFLHFTSTPALSNKQDKTIETEMLSSI